jgi:hypothetical protein
MVAVNCLTDEVIDEVDLAVGLSYERGGAPAARAASRVLPEFDGNFGGGLRPPQRPAGRLRTVGVEERVLVFRGRNSDRGIVGVLRRGVGPNRGGGSGGRSR